MRTDEVRVAAPGHDAPVQAWRGSLPALMATLTCATAGLGAVLLIRPWRMEDPLAAGLSFLAAFVLLAMVMLPLLTAAMLFGSVLLAGRSLGRLALFASDDLVHGGFLSELRRRLVESSDPVRRRLGFVMPSQWLGEPTPKWREWNSRGESDNLALLAWADGEDTRAGREGAAWLARHLMPDESVWLAHGLGPPPFGERLIPLLGLWDAVRGREDICPHQRLAFGLAVHALADIARAGCVAEFEEAMSRVERVAGGFDAEPSRFSFHPLPDGFWDRRGPRSVREACEDLDLSGRP